MQQQQQTASLWKTSRTIVQQESIFALWKGTWPTILRNVPGSGLYFFTLNQLRSRGKQTGLKSHWINLSSGVIARVAVGYIMMPITVIKVKMEGKKEKSSLLETTRGILKQHGIRGLFAGFGATAMRDAPFAGIYVFFYEYLKSLVSIQHPLVNMASGLASGCAATWFTQPFDMMKTKIQLDPLKYKHMWSAGSLIVKEEGFIGFFKGSLPRVMRKSFSSAISWTVYEEFIKRFK